MKDLISLFGKLGNTIYIQIWEDRLKLTDISTGKILELSPYVAIETNSKQEKVIKAVGEEVKTFIRPNVEIVNPFSHPRTLLSDFTVAEKALQHGIRQLLSATFIRPAPVIVIQPMEKNEGGFTTIEERAFTELAYGAGAREVYFSNPSHTLSKHELEQLFQELKLNKKRTFSIVKYSIYFIVICVFVINLFNK